MAMIATRVRDDPDAHPVSVVDPGVVIHGGPCKVFTAGLDLKAEAGQKLGC